MDQSPPKPKPPPLKDRTPLLEWLAAGVGLIVIVAVLGYVLWDGLQHTDAPPAIAVRVVRVTPTPAGYVAEIEALNRNRTTAANVEVEGVLERGGREIESSTTTFDYVPGLGRRQGGLLFETDPRGFDLRPAVKGYVDP